MDINFTAKTLVSLFLVSIVGAACTVKSPTDFNGTVGGNATFLWNTTNTSIVEVLWGLYDRKNDAVAPLFITVSTLIPGLVEFSSDLDNNASVASRYKDRVHFIGNISQGRAWFVITKLSLSDKNEYVARIKEAGSSSQKCPVKLAVEEDKYKPVAVKFTNSPRQDPFCRGNSTTFTCNATANPPAEYSLYRNNQLVQSRSMNGQFVVQLDVKGANTFTCVPNNTVGIGANKTIQFFVTDPPSIVESPQNVTLVEGRPLTLLCKASGHPAPNITWSKVGGNTVGHGDTFTIGSVVRGHEGYRCVVNNGAECKTVSALAYVTVINSTPSPSGLSTGEIIAIAVVVPLLGIGIIVVIVVVFKKYKNDGNQIDRHNDTKGDLQLKTDKVDVEGQEGGTQPEA